MAVTTKRDLLTAGTRIPETIIEVEEDIDIVDEDVGTVSGVPIIPDMTRLPYERLTLKQYEGLIRQLGYVQYARAYAKYVHFVKRPKDMLQHRHYELFCKLKQYIRAFRLDRDRRPQVVDRLGQHFNRELFEMSNLAILKNYESGKIILNDGKVFEDHEFERLFNYLIDQPQYFAVRQNGAGAFASDVVERYTDSIKEALVAHKLKVVTQGVNIFQLALSVMQLVLCIINVATYGSSVGKVSSLVVSIAQVLAAITSVVGDHFVIKQGGQALEVISSLVAEYFGTVGVTERQFSMPSVEIIVSAVCGMIGLGIAGMSMFSVGWAKDFSKNVVEGDRFRKALRSSVKDARGFVEEVAEACFDVKLSPLSKTFDRVKAVSEEVSGWLQKPDSYLVAHPCELAKFAVCLGKANELYTSYRVKTNELESRYTNSLNLLFQNIIVAKGRLDHLRRLRKNERTKQEPPAFTFVGRPGAGKTHFINTYVIPEVQKRMGWSEEKYVVDFGNQPEFWPPYLGEPIAFYDEFLSLKAKDPVVPHLNRICSTEHNIIPGANTYTKEQECLFKLLLLGSNVHYQSFADVLATESERAMYSRLIRFEVVNRTCPPEDVYDRNRITHSAGYEELEFRRFIKPPSHFSVNAKEVTPSGTNTLQLTDPYVVVTKEQIIEEIIQFIVRKQEEYLKFNAKDDTVARDTLGNYIPTDPLILEKNPVIHNLLSEVPASRSNAAPSYSRTIVAKIGTDDYTAETLEYYFRSAFALIGSAQNNVEPAYVEKVLTQLENVILQDKFDLGSVLECVSGEAFKAQENLRNEDRLRLIRLYAVHGRKLNVGGVSISVNTPQSPGENVIPKVTRYAMPMRRRGKRRMAPFPTAEMRLSRALAADIEEVEENASVEGSDVVVDEFHYFPVALGHVLEDIRNDDTVLIHYTDVHTEFDRIVGGLHELNSEYIQSHTAFIARRPAKEEYDEWRFEVSDLVYDLRSLTLTLSNLAEDGKRSLNPIWHENLEDLHVDLKNWEIITQVSDALAVAEKQNLSIVEHLVLYVHGPPGTGKSTVSCSMALQLAENFAMPFVEIKTQTLSGVVISTASVIVLHDKVRDEEAYSQWYDGLPSGCIIFNTNNYYAKQCSGVRAMVSRVRKYYTIESSEQTPGYARRCGLPGYVWHSGQWSHTEESMRAEISVPTFGKYLFNGVNSTVAVMLRELASRYMAMSSIHNQIRTERVEAFEDEFVGDLTFRAASLDILRNAVTSARTMMRAYARPDAELSITITNALMHTDFTFNANDFVLPHCQDDRDLIEVAIKTYSLLRRGGRELTAHIVTPEVEIRCAGACIRMHCAENQEQKALSWDVIDREGVLCIRVREVSPTAERDIGIYEARQVMSAFVYGFHTLYPTHPEFRVMSYLMRNKDVIQQHPMLLPFKVLATPIVINAGVVTQEYTAFRAMWTAFAQTKVFKVIMIVGIVLITMGTLFLLWKIGSYIARMFGGEPEERKCPEFIVIDGVKYLIHPNVVGNMVHFQITPPAGAVLDVPLITPVLETIVSCTYGEKYNVGNVLGVLQEYGSLNPHGTKARAPRVAARRLITTAQGMLDNDGHTAVRNKILAAQVVVSYGALRMYGLRWKERDVIFPAHLITNSSKIVNVTLPISVGGDSYAMVTSTALAYHCDYANDIAVARISDSSVPQSSNITKYFHREKQMPLLSNAVLMKRAGVCDAMTYYTQSVECFAGNVSVTRMNGKSVMDTPNVALEFYLSQYRNIPTKAGDCGSVYVSMDTACNTAMIIGLHTNRDISGKKTWGNVISQEYLLSIRNQPVVTARQAATNEIVVPYDAVRHPAFEPVSKKWAFEEVYYDTMTTLEDVTESDIFYDAENNPDSNLLFLGRETKFKPSWIGKPSHEKTPWYDELVAAYPSIAPDITPQGYLSLTDAKNHPAPETLSRINGRPSVIANEINMFSDPIPWDSFHEELLDEALSIYRTKIDADYGRRFRVLTDLETVNGLYFANDEYYGHFDAMDLDTSSGDYPKRFFNITRKRPLFAKIESEIDRDVYFWANTEAAHAVRASCLYAEHSALEGKRMVYPALDSLKYELQSKPNKARCFQCLSIQDVLLMRKYTGALQSVIAQRCLSGTCSVGIDPVVGFHQLMLRFKRTSVYGEAGDYKRWDKHVLARLIKVVMQDIAERYMETDPKNAEGIQNVFNVIVDTIVYTVCMCEGNWYVKMRGNPSGNVLTSVMNSLINLLMTYMGLVYIIKQHNSLLLRNPTEHELLKHYGVQHRAKTSLMKKRIPSIAQWIFKYFDSVYYGDDELAVVHPDFLWLVDFYAFQRFYVERLGIDYDSPTKDGNCVAYDRLTNLSFLSRTFREQNGTILPALKKETVNAFLYWARRNTVDQWETLCEAALTEAVLHPRDYYEQVRDVICWISGWCQKHSIDFSYIAPMYETKLQETVTLIRQGRSVGSVFTPSDQRIGVRFEIEGKPCLVVKATTLLPLTQRSKTVTSESLSCVHCDPQILQEVKMGNQPQKLPDTQLTDAAVFDDLIAIHEKLLIQFQDWQGTFITGYHPYPALVVAANGNRISVGFRANDYQQSSLRQIQSDLAKYITAQVGLRTQLITVCYRILNPSTGYAEPIWQVQFTSNATTPPERLMATGIVLETRKKTSTTQATGTADMGMIEEHVAENDADVTMPVTQGVARGVLTRAPIWHLNLAETVTQYRETLDSPLAVAMGTAVHVVIDKLSYGDMSKMPTCMRWWAFSHESGAPTVWIEYKFISAATIVNQLIVGLADCNKTSYTMEELQQIEGVVINPQEGTIAVPLKLAATSLTNEAPTRINLSQTAISGTDAAPVNLPTLVLLTATAIQNSYDNDKVQVNIRKKAKFGNLREPWFVTSRSLAAMRSVLAPAPTPPSGMFANFTNMSVLLGLPQGYPLHMTLDGSYLQSFVHLPSRVSVHKNLPMLDENSSIGGVTQIWSAVGSTMRYYSECDATGGSVWTAEFMEEDILNRFYGTVKDNQATASATNYLTATMGTPTPPFVPRWTAIMMGQGNAPLPSSTAHVDCIGGPLTTDSVKTVVIDPWLSGIDEHYSYTVSELAVPQVVDIHYLRHTTTLGLFGSIGIQDVGGFVTMLPVDHGVVTGFPARPFRQFTFTHVVEFAHESEGASTIYVGYANEGFVGDATAGLLQIDPESSTDVVRYTAMNFESPTWTSTQTPGLESPLSNAVITSTFSPLRGTEESVSLADQPARIVETRNVPVSTLGATMSRLVFANTLPKTVPQTIADSKGNVEVRDDYCYQQLRLYIDRAGVVVRSDQVLTFQLFMQAGIQVVATVVYDTATNEMYVVNEPTVSSDSYLAFRKLSAEDVYIGNFRVIEKASGVISTTNTAGWINRVVSDTSVGVYTGSLITKLKVQSARKIVTTQAEAMLPLLMAGGSATSSIFSGLMQYFMMKNQMSLAQQQKLEAMEKEFQYKLKLQQNSQEWKEKMAGISSPMATSPNYSASQYPGLGFVPAGSSTDTAGGEASPSDSGTSTVPATDTFDQQISRFRDMLYNHAGISNLGDGGKVEPPSTDAAALGLETALSTPTVQTPSNIQPASFKKQGNASPCEIYGSNLALQPKSYLEATHPINWNLKSVF